MSMSALYTISDQFENKTVKDTFKFSLARVLTQKYKSN